MTRKRFQKLTRAKYTEFYLINKKTPFLPSNLNKKDFRFNLKFVKFFRPKNGFSYQEAFDELSRGLRDD